MNKYINLILSTDFFLLHHISIYYAKITPREQSSTSDRTSWIKWFNTVIKE